MKPRIGVLYNAETDSLAYYDLKEEKEPMIPMTLLGNGDGLEWNSTFWGFQWLVGYFGWEKIGEL